MFSARRKSNSPYAILDRPRFSINPVNMSILKIQKTIHRFLQGMQKNSKHDFRIASGSRSAFDLVLSASGEALKEA